MAQASAAGIRARKAYRVVTADLLKLLRVDVPERTSQHVETTRLVMGGTELPWWACCEIKKMNTSISHVNG